MGEIQYPMINAFYKWQTRMVRVSAELQINYLKKKDILIKNQRYKNKKKIKTWAQYFKLW